MTMIKDPILAVKARQKRRSEVGQVTQHVLGGDPFHLVVVCSRGLSLKRGSRTPCPAWRQIWFDGRGVKFRQVPYLSFTQVGSPSDSGSTPRPLRQSLTSAIDLGFVIGFNQA